MIDRGTGGAAPRNTREKSVISPGTRTATPYTPKKTKKNQLKLSANAEVLRKPLGKQKDSWASGPLGGQGGR